MDPITAMFEDNENDDTVIIGRVITYDEYMVSGNTLRVKRTEYAGYLKNQQELY